MPTILHSALSGADLHEPKGISAAAAGLVYRSNGTGGGSWTPLPSGWGYYQHDGAAQVIATTDTKLQINGSGALSTNSYLPRAIRGSGTLWDTTNNKVTPIALGDSYILRLDLPISAKSGTPTEMSVKFDVGGGVTPSIVALQHFVSVSKTAPYTITFAAPMWVISTTKTNGIQIFISVDSGSVSILNPSISVFRNSAGDF